MSQEPRKDEPRGFKSSPASPVPPKAFQTKGVRELTFVCCLGDAAVALLKAGAEMDKPDLSGKLALDLAPDKEVSLIIRCCLCIPRV